MSFFDLRMEITFLHRHQCGLALHVERLRTSMTVPNVFSSYQVPQRRHPVLANAMYLWASFLSRPGPLSLNEPQFLSKAQNALADALNSSQHPSAAASPQLLHQSIVANSTISPSLSQSPSPEPATASPSVVLDTIQAVILLARYFFAIGRLHAASYYSNAGASLAIQSGLHQIHSSLALAVSQQHQPLPALSGLNAVYSSELRLPPAQDGVELGERINVFWEVFYLDRMLSVALRRPPVIVDDDSIESQIDTPWPDDVEEYETVRVILYQMQLHGQLT